MLVHILYHNFSCVQRKWVIKHNNESDCYSIRNIWMNWFSKVLLNSWYNKCGDAKWPKYDYVANNWFVWKLKEKAKIISCAFLIRISNRIKNFRSKIDFDIFLSKVGVIPNFIVSIILLYFNSTKCSINIKRSITDWNWIVTHTYIP